MLLFFFLCRFCVRTFVTFIEAQRLWTQESNNPTTTDRTGARATCTQRVIGINNDWKKDESFVSECQYKRSHKHSPFQWQPTANIFKNCFRMRRHWFAVHWSLLHRIPCRIYCGIYFVRHDINTHTKSRKKALIIIAKILALSLWLSLSLSRWLSVLLFLANSATDIDAFPKHIVYAIAALQFIFAHISDGQMGIYYSFSQNFDRYWTLAAIGKIYS